MNNNIRKMGRKARRTAVRSAKAALDFGAVALGFLALVAVLALMIAMIEGLAAVLGIPSFVLYLLIWILLWITQISRVPAPSI